MGRLSKKAKELVEQAVQEAREKPKRARVVKERAPKGTKIPDNVWLDDPAQGCVFIIDGYVLRLDINYETGVVKTIRTRWEEWKPKKST